ncbi:MAG: GAF domain-containing protein [Longimicrobiales bacterium]
MHDTDDTFPFRRALTLEPLIDFWRAASTGTSPARADLAARLLERVDAAPELRGVIEDATVLEQHADLIETLLGAVFPPAVGDEMLGAALPPFTLKPFFLTQAFQETTLFEQLVDGMDHYQLLRGRAIVAYHFLLANLYGQESLDFHVAFPFRVTDPVTRLDRHFSLTIEPHFVRIVETGLRPELTPAQIGQLLADRMNLDLWQQLLPPATFEFHGFVTFVLQDVTDQQIIASLTSDLLRTDAMARPEQIDMLQDRLRSLLRRPDLRLGVLSVERDDGDAITGARPIGRSLLVGKGEAPECPQRAQSYYTKVIESHQPVFIRDLSCCDVQTGFEAQVMGQGVRNLLVAPLRVDDHVIGLLELGSPNPGDLHALNSRWLKEVISLFSIALKRMLDERETQVQAIIKQKYTAIHPAVEWRFRDAARNYLATAVDGQYAAVEPIVFDEVYPLYGLSDIRGSSQHRSGAIQADLLEQLELARTALAAANREQPLPVLAELEQRLITHVDSIRDGLRSGDEIRVLDFLRIELEDVFEQLSGFGGDTTTALHAYRSALDPELGFLYGQRRQFEDSVSRITETIAAFLEREQEKAQMMFPHYFEKFKTDGVDYNIYIGASLQPGDRFQPIFLRNLRLWQLMTMCGVVWELRRIESALPVPLQVAHMILAQSTPLAIRFRADEKRFDVDGAYNARYEIIKKRIDKARVKGTREQLTQPGRIAVVYSHPREAAEYARFFEFLRARKYVEAGVEELELEDLQGARGLQALRVTVAPEPGTNAEPTFVDTLASFTREREPV